jgi:glutamine synthetase
MNKATLPPEFARPAFVEQAQAEFKTFLEAHCGLQYVDAAIADMNGVLRGKRFPIAEANRLFDSGMQIPYTIYLLDTRGEMTNPFGRGFGDGDPDGTAWPIPGTLSRVGAKGPPRAQMLMTLRDETGAPEPAEPRAALERAVERLGELGLVAVTALELEFYLIDRTRDPSGAPLPPLNPETGLRECTTSVYGIDDLDRYEAFLGSLAEAAHTQNVPLSAVSKEYAPGQFEANLKHQPDACRAADYAVLLKQIVKAAARTHGFDATFMAKPFADRAGNGLHIHLSLLDERGRNIFSDGTSQGSPRLREAIAGLQSLMPESMALFAPNVNSYRRFQPDMFAPVNRHWGVNNRSAGLRVPIGPDDSRRVEHRVAGADANPYLALAGVLAGAHHGLVGKLDPGAPATGNVSREADPGLPLSLDDALAGLAQSRKLAFYFGEDTLSLYGETKRLEAQRVRRAITPAEYDWYL